MNKKKKVSTKLSMRKYMFTDDLLESRHAYATVSLFSNHVKYYSFNMFHMGI